MSDVADNPRGREMRTPAFTVLGKRCVEDARIHLCLCTWRNLGTTFRVRVLNDGTLSPAHVDIIREQYGFEIVPEAEIEALVTPRIAGLSHVRNYLARVRHFKKAVYAPLLAAAEKRALILDSDVFLTRPITFADDAPALLISPDDVPAYRLHWSAPFRVPVATCINSGFVYFTPQIIDVAYLDYCFEHCRSRTQNTWWIEQASWALYAGSSPSAGYFSGEDVRVIGALGKRTVMEVRRNKFAWYRATRTVDEAEMRKHIADAAVMHFAGGGKPWISLAAAEHSDERPRTLRWEPLPHQTFATKALLAVRLAGIEWSERARELRRQFV